MGEKDSLLKIICQFDQMQRRIPTPYWCSLLAMCLKQVKEFTILGYLSLAPTSSSCSQTFPSSSHQLQHPIYTANCSNDSVTWLLKEPGVNCKPVDTQRRPSSSSQGSQRCGHTWCCISPEQKFHSAIYLWQEQTSFMRQTVVACGLIQCLIPSLDLANKDVLLLSQTPPSFLRKSSWSAMVKYYTVFILCSYISYRFEFLW